MSEVSANRILNNPVYRHLIEQRDALAFTLSACVLVLFYGFILLIAFAPEVLTTPIAADSVIPWGILIGVGVIVGSIVLTGIYVFQANSKFDPMIDELLRDASK
jgi:uncharacterized membrane protein (DUF485 family)